MSRKLIDRFDWTRIIELHRTSFLLATGFAVHSVIRVAANPGGFKKANCDARSGEEIVAAVSRRFSKDEFARRGDLAYESAVRPHLKPEDEGRFVAINIVTSEFEIDGDEL